jgi:CHAT domain
MSDDGIAIMVQPGLSDRLVPRLLLEQGGLWRECDEPIAHVSPTVARNQLANAMRLALSPDAAGVTQPIKGLSGKCAALYQCVVGDDLRRVLKDVSSRDDPPVLRIHISEGYEWIPWEVMYDGDFLGLGFRITRLPITRTPPDRPPGGVHPVQRVQSLLGRGVTNTAEEFKNWHETFVGLLPPTVAATLLPEQENDGGWPQRNNIMEQLDALPDIVHVTCHGIRDKELGPIWTLDIQNPKGAWAYTIAPQDVAVMSTLADVRPLVFGNACGDDVAGTDDDADKTSAAEAGSQELARTFFATGALNVVGSFAPIRRDLALRFAPIFYRHLLVGGDDIGTALWRSKLQCLAAVGDQDPSFLFYCLYGPAETHYAPVNGGSP